MLRKLRRLLMATKSVPPVTLSPVIPEGDIDVWAWRAAGHARRQFSLPASKFAYLFEHARDIAQDGEPYSEVLASTTVAAHNAAKRLARAPRQGQGNSHRRGMPRRGGSGRRCTSPPDIDIEINMDGDDPQGVAR